MRERPGKEPEDNELLLEKIRGKLDERIHNHTLAEEYRIMNDQIVKSQGFDVDFSKLRYLFDFQPAFLDELYPLGKPDTRRVYFRRLAPEAVEIYNKREPKILFTRQKWCSKLRSSMCSVERLYTASAGLNPNQEGTCEDEDSIAEKASVRRTNKRKHGLNIISSC
ncbi:hypothetical protein F2Q70_00005262 [Brassica cretica]|uniref:Uncharacterized protein n=1 Tax=Brassica cretica TaxID=69181 RepID=A0A8S9IXP9_BRACR|nr:hypothetical protein F2Q68_00021897 [Brassica cretica]KAF2574609.1 hypothetical protein F2Q70_00005262 [Brassica cretica]